TRAARVEHVDTVEAVAALAERGVGVARRGAAAARAEDALEAVRHPHVRVTAHAALVAARAGLSDHLRRIAVQAEDHAGPSAALDRAGLHVDLARIEAACGDRLGHARIADAARWAASQERTEQHQR